MRINITLTLLRVRHSHAIGSRSALREALMAAGRGGNEDEDADEFQGRLLVLSLQGDLLQVVTHPTEPTAEFTSICCFDRKLLASYRCREPAWATWKYGVLALQGL